MRVLFLVNSNMWKHTLPEAFIELGHEVEISGEVTERKISSLISEFKPDLIMSMGWSPEQTMEKQMLIRRYSKNVKIPHVYWSLEDPAFTWCFSLPLIQRMEPDYVFSICPSTVDYFKKLDIKSAHMDFGYAPKLHQQVETVNKYKSSIAIVANGYPDVLTKYPKHFRHQSLKTLISPLIKENIRVDFWGNNWKDMGQFIGCEIPNDWIHGYLPYTEANKVYSSSDIIIGLQNYPTQLTQRTYEILASEGCLITVDTPGVRQKVKPGKDLIVSSSPEETLKLIKYYLKNLDECRKIAEQGKNSVAKHSYKNRAQFMIDTLKREGIL
ncbi:glycosyltransferase [Mycoplasmatota bacterium zrk1]